MMETLDSTSKLEDLHIHLIDGSKIRLGGFHVDLIYKLRELPTWKILDVMQISDEALIGAIEERRKAYCDIALSFFKKEWQWRETGELVTFADAGINDVLFGVHATGKDICKLLKRKAKSLTYEKITHIVEVFRSENEIVEVYP